MELQPISFTLDKESLDAIDKMAAANRCKRSQALRLLIADWMYLTSRFAALSRRPPRETEYHGEGVA